MGCIKETRSLIALLIKLHVCSGMIPAEIAELFEISEDRVIELISKYYYSSGYTRPLTTIIRQSKING